MAVTARTTPAELGDVALVRRGRGTPGARADAARGELVARYEPLVRSSARRFAAGGRHRHDDLLSTATEGLLKALRDFDPDRGVPFAAYARAKVHGELLRHVRDARWAVHVPRPLHERFMQVRRAEGDLTTELGRSPTVDEVADRLRLGPDEVLEALAVGSADRARIEALTTTLAGPDEDRAARLDLAAGLGRLDARSRLVLVRRYWEGRSQAEIGAELGVSQGQVSRIERHAREELHACLAPGR